MEQEKISERLKRINELAHKAKAEGLTEEETIERDQLRKEYLADFRAKLRSTVEQITIVEEDGSHTPLKRK
ncbi:DUF896 domain-containing protein [Chakrabartyella piscis]|uniref:DUF896 domain-containing protein n=1 Tax=Chakrabartyella piscis TaxID=2918914 RepID=UPI002958D259|nr:DUF896 domain-containing protein [Chakrabartyella piscis]